jgi:hypothetical protein
MTATPFCIKYGEKANANHTFIEVGEYFDEET